MKKILCSLLVGIMLISSLSVSASVDFSTYIESLGMTVDEVLVEAFELKEQYFSTDDLGEKERIFTRLKLLTEATSKEAHVSLAAYTDVREDYEKILKVKETGNKYINDDLETIRLKLRGYSAKATGFAGQVVDGTFQQETITEEDKADIIALLDASILNGSIKKGGSEHFASGENVAISKFSVAIDALYNTIKGQEGYEDVIAKIKEVQNILNSDKSNTKAEEITNNINNSSVVFIDVKKTDWYYSQVMAMTEKGLFKGKGNNMFCPNDTMTRAEFIAVVVRALYSDVDMTLKRDQAWWEPVYEVATDKGLITESEFPISSIEQTIPRQEMAVISVRALYALGETDIEEYKYVPDLHVANILYRDEVSKAYGAGIIVGEETGKFNPEKTLTRAEASTVLYRIIEKSARAEVEFDLQAPITTYEGTNIGDVTSDNMWIWRPGMWMLNFNY